MRCIVAPQQWLQSPCEVLVVAISDQWRNSPHVLELDQATGGLLTKLIDSGEISTKPYQLTTLYSVMGVASSQLLFVGVGEQQSLSPLVANRAAGAAMKKIATKYRERVRFSGFQGTPVSERAAVCGSMVACVGQDLFRQDKSLIQPEYCEWVGMKESTLLKGAVIGDSINLVRRLVNMPANFMYPESFVDEIFRTGQQFKFEVEIWDKSKLEAERCGALLGVARGSSCEPRLAIMRYRGGDSTTPPTALVGKGVTFDSGGYSLKPSDSMLTMKCDMAGAATVLGIMQAAAMLNAKCNLVGVVGLVENMVSGNAFKLGDVLMARSGKTIEIHNTDAEGRLVLADCLSVALDSHPSKIVDFATLTGACVVALGNDISGAMSNDREWQAEIMNAAEEFGEYVWPLPMHAFFSEQIAGKIADIKNVGEGRWGGAITAAKFLEEFVGQTPWTHLDIAGPAFLDSAKAWCDAGGTGTLVRTFVEMLTRDSTETV
ncbi:MAG: leucyl aminopeptidase [Pirellula sp.]|jgi:leucyl aminopeptidase